MLCFLLIGEVKITFEVILASSILIGNKESRPPLGYGVWKVHFYYHRRAVILFREEFEW